MERPNREVLLQISTAEATLKIFGPLEELTIFDREAPQPKLSVSTNPECGALIEVRPAGEPRLRHWEPTLDAPLFREERDYLLTALATPPNVPGLDISRLEEAVKDVDSNGSFLAVSFRFRSLVGHVPFVVDIGSQTIKFEIEVFPSKMDYSRDFLEIIDALSSLQSGLGIDFARATRLGASQRKGRRASGSEWLSLLESEVSELGKTLRFINDHPHLSIDVADQVKAIHRVRMLTPGTLRKLSTGRGSGGWVTMGRFAAREFILTQERAASTRNSENGWLKGRLVLIATRLGEISRFLRDDKNSLRAAEISKKRSQQRGAVRVLQTKIGSLLGMPIFDAQPEPKNYVPSLTLMAKPGYAEAYAALQRLARSVDLVGSMLSASTRQLFDLYEHWVFLFIVDSLRAVCGVSGSDALPRLRSDPLNVSFVKGADSVITFRGHSRTVSVHYNAEFEMLTGTQKPDVVVELFDDGLPPIYVLFDAKYRVTSAAEYVKIFGCPGPPVDAVNSLHRYRDAIMIESKAGQVGRPVVMGAAIFPLPADENDRFRRGRLFRSLSTVGIGALPLLPSNDELLKEFLGSVFSSSRKEFGELLPRDLIRTS